ncbi:MAG: hypothetical protein FD135_2355 [Comamonadaceae bacterium]|nr:MAG: hypothetical protein FD135_2355 [Comamonadaceae bacterium]
MNKILIQMALLIGMPTLTYLGFLGGVEGALYMVKFFVWAICLPIGLLALTEKAQKNLAKQPASGALYRFAARIVAWTVLGIMVWTGHIATACAWGLYLLCAAIAGEGAKKHRAEAEASAP